MPQPTRSDVHIDVALTNISIAFIQDATHFVAGRVFPGIPVQKQSDKYFTYEKRDWRRDEAKPRAPGTESSGGGYDISNDNYSAEVYAHHKDVPDQIRDNADAAINSDEDATRYVMQILMLQKEVNFASTYFTTSVWGTDAVAGTDFTAWDDASSDPEKDIDDAKAAVLLATGFEPNTLTVGYKVHLALKRHPLVLDKFKYTSSESITEAMLARVFEVDNYVVAKASYDTSAEDAASASNSYVLGNHALLTYTPPSPGLLTPAAGYTFTWTGLTGINNAGVAVSSFRMQHLKSDRVEGELAYDHKVVSSELGYFFQNAAS